MEGPERFTGGRLCGSVRIVASGRPYRVGVCHCLDCRKHHDALFHAAAIFPLDDRSSCSIIGVEPRKGRAPIQGLWPLDVQGSCSFRAAER